MAYNVGFDDFSRNPRDAARKTWGGWLFVASLVLGSIAILAGYSPVTGQQEPPNSLSAVFVLASAGIAAFLSWRVMTGKGWLAGSILLLWWAVEILIKIVAGQLGIVWIAFHLAGIVNLAIGVRACWRLRGTSPDDADLVATFE